MDSKEKQVLKIIRSDKKKRAEENLEYIKQKFPDFYYQMAELGLSSLNKEKMLATMVRRHILKELV